MHEYQVILLFSAFVILAGFAFYAFREPDWAKKYGRPKINVRYLCSGHLKAERKEKEFVVLSDSSCIICKEIKK